MLKIDLAGEWTLCRDGEESIAGKLPGSTYIDYIEAGLDDPFWGENEVNANALARHDFSYSREFFFTEELLAAEHIDFVASGLDTLCEIKLNGALIGAANNIYRTWRFDAKPQLRAGENVISINIRNPYEYIARRQAADPLPRFSGNGVAGSSHLRKTPCHFGWDWGPKLPPAGVTGEIGFELYDVKIDDFRIRQEHNENSVKLRVSASLSRSSADIEAIITLIDPDGAEISRDMAWKSGAFSADIDIESPKLWWVSELGEQPLYEVTVKLMDDGATLDSQTRRIGLRTVRLDTAEDENGAQFRFIVNGVPIFARGANWIPCDSFITRATREDVDFYIDAAKRANMNMLRVWGGGMYESEYFYDACDRNGILVWQDFIFACAAYPLYDDAFLDNVRNEVIDQVRRLRHRASLAVWCGNNEAEVFRRLWHKNGKVAASNMPFYHNTLRGWVKELDGVTAYWPGSPSGGDMKYKAHNLKPGATRGDAHLWQIWHGMQPIEAFRKYPARFLSEYGMESMPSMHTLRTFTDDIEPDLFSPVMRSHQKSVGGNEKIMFYLLAKYRNPAAFEDFIYLSQLVQSNTVRFATDCRRRSIGAQNGALFWQLNDCWPVASWAGIDYGKQLKAVMYHAREFNKPLCISNDYYKDRAELHVINEYPEPFSGRLEWKLSDFNGNEISSGYKKVNLKPVTAARFAIVDYHTRLKGALKEEAVLTARLVDDDDVFDVKNWLLVPDKDAALRKPNIETRVRVYGDTARVSVSSDTYARYVYLEAEGVTAPWSDNFFDIPANETIEARVELPEGMTEREFCANLRVKSLADVTPKGSRFGDKLLRLSMVFRKKNFLTWLAFKFI